LTLISIYVELGMTFNRKPSRSTCLVLFHLSGQAEYGYSLMKATGLKSGTLYPILMRLKERGLLSAEWEASEIPGRPPRQRYQLTTKGRAYAKEALNLDINIPSFKGVKT